MSFYAVSVDVANIRILLMKNNYFENTKSCDILLWASISKVRKIKERLRIAFLTKKIISVSVYQ